MNLPISTKAPTPATAHAAAASQAQDDPSQVADPFANVLARQLGDSSAASTHPAQVAGDLAIAADSDKKAGKQAGGDLPTAAPTDMLAALLAGSVAQSAAKPADGKAAASINLHGKATAASLKDHLALQKPLLTQAAGAQPGAAIVGNAKEPQFSAVLHGVAGTPLGATFEATHKSAAATTAPLDNSQTVPVALPQLGTANLQPAATKAVSQLSVDSQVGSPSWDNDFNQKITWLATQHEQSAELQLNPPNLGPLHVTLNVSGDQATAIFASPHAAVRDAVEQALPKLREMMADNGIMLGNATVSDHGQRDNQAYQSPEQRRTQSGAIGGIGDGMSGISQGTRAIAVAKHNGLVDTFA